MTRKLIAALAALSAALPASAGNLRLGPAKIDASVAAEARYEDNIYRVPRNENGHAVAGGGVRGSLIVAETAALKATVPLGRHKLTAAYDVTNENYKTQPRANNAVNQRADGAWEYEGSKINAKVWDTYLNTQDPAFNPNSSVINGELVQRERRWQNNVGASAEYGLGDKFFFGVDGEAQVHKYLNRAGGAASLANLLNRSEQLFGVKTGYKVAPKTRVYVAGHRRLVHYTEGTRQDNHRDWLGDAGIEGEFTAKLKGKIEGGYEYRQYDRDSANPTRDELGRIFRVQTQLDFRATDTTQAVLTVNRGTNESASTASRYFTSTGASLALNQKLGAKLSAGLSGAYQVDRYSQDFTIGTLTQTRRDDNYQAGAKLDYKFTDWLGAGATYVHNRRHSTFSREYSYRDNISGAHAKLSF